MASATCIERCADIIESQLEMERNAHKRTSFTSDEVVPAQDPSQSKSKIPHIAVVVSAMGGKPKVTDLLLSTVKSASQRDASSSTLTLSQILTKHSTAISELGLPAPTAQRIISRVEKDINDITDVLKTVSLMKWQAERISELVSGYGELWSALILCEVLNERVKRRREVVEGEDGVNAFLEEHGSGTSVEEWDDEFLYVDARRVITLDDEVGGVCWDLSLEKLLNMYQNDPLSQDVVRKTMDGSEIKYRRHLVITGYVASNTQGVATTLQRDGSDYSASIIGRLLSASSVNIWTDVDGVMSADPRRVPSAFCIPEVSFNEAMELAYFGAKVIHPKTMTPAMTSKIPI